MFQQEKNGHKITIFLHQSDSTASSFIDLFSADAERWIVFLKPGWLYFFARDMIYYVTLHLVNISIYAGRGLKKPWKPIVAIRYREALKQIHLLFSFQTLSAGNRPIKFPIYLCTFRIIFGLRPPDPPAEQLYVAAVQVSNVLYGEHNSAVLLT